jgi:hypothetical protein
VPGSRAQGVRDGSSARWKSLLVSTGVASIKIEPNLVIRGTVYPTEERRLVRAAEKLFELSVAVRVLSDADLYGGKICAALDRQHPRDLFDAMVMLDNEGLPERTRKAFVVYLASHDRPMHELLSPSKKDIRRVFETDFAGMTRVPAVYDDLIRARDILIETIRRDLTVPERQFLISLKAGEPEWPRLGVVGVERLPAIH